jgi:hypothetical protein
VWVSSFSPTVLESLRLNRLRLMINFGNFTTRAVLFLVCGLAGLDIIATVWVFVAVCSLYQVLIVVVSARVVMLHDSSMVANRGQDLPSGKQGN